MTSNSIALDRRDVLVAALSVVGSALLPGLTHAATSSDGVDPAFAPHANDWKWLIGSWSVKHRRLRDRLAGRTQWDEFAGTCVNWPLMGGRGNVDDNVLDLPSGRYRDTGAMDDVRLARSFPKRHSVS